MGEGGEGHTIPFCRAGSGMGLGSVLWSKEKPAGGAGGDRGRPLRQPPFVRILPAPSPWITGPGGAHPPWEADIQLKFRHPFLPLPPGLLFSLQRGEGGALWGCRRGSRLPPPLRLLICKGGEGGGVAGMGKKNQLLFFIFDKVIKTKALVPPLRRSQQGSGGGGPPFWTGWGVSPWSP